MKEIFYEIIKEAATGNILIDNEEWSIAFNTIIYDKDINKCSFFNESNLSTLVINNEEEFLRLLNIYIQKELEVNRKKPTLLENTNHNTIKLLISYLFANASIIDFEEPIQYLKRRIKFLDDKTFNNLDISINLKTIFSPKIKEDIYLEIKNVKQDIRMETPNRLELSIVKKDINKSLHFHLPSISYGISEHNGKDICYLYSIINKKNESTNKEEQDYIKAVSRLLYKINDGVTEEDIKDVSMSSVLSLSIFISLLKQKEINKIKEVLYLPVRYLSREIAAVSKEEDKKNILLERNDYIQRNITDKFLRTIKRVIYHIEGIEIFNDILLDNGSIELNLNSSKNDTNNIFISHFTNSIHHK